MRWVREYALLLLVILPLSASGEIGTPQERVQQIFHEVRLTADWEPYVESLYDADLQRLIEVGPDAVPELIATVQNAPMRSMRISLSIDALGEFRDPRGLPCLIDALSYRHLRPYRGINALIAAIVKFGKDALNELKPLALTGPPQRRSAALQAINGIGGRQATRVHLQILRLQDENDDLILTSIGMLGRLGDPKFESMFLEMLEESRPASDERARVLIDALGDTGTSMKGDKALMQILRTTDSTLKREAASALGKRKSSAAIPLLIESLQVKRTEQAGVEPDVATSPLVCPGYPEPSLREVVIDALAAYGPLATNPLVRAVASDSRSDIGSGALSALAKGRHPKAKSIFLKVLADESLPKQTRLDAIRGLARIADASVVDALISVREEPPTKFHQDLVKALVAIGKDARPQLRKSIDAESFLQRSTAVDALSRIGDERDFPLLADHITQEENGRVALLEFLALARKRQHPVLDAALWELAEANSINSSDAIEVLSLRPDVNVVAVQRVAKACLVGKPHGWQILKLLAALERVGVGGCAGEVLALLDHVHADIRSGAADLLSQQKQNLLLSFLQENPLHEEAIHALRLCEQSLAAQRVVVQLLQDPKPNLPLLRMLGRKAKYDPSTRRWPGASDVLLDHLGRDDWSYYTSLITKALANMGDARAIEAVIDRDQSCIRDLVVFGPHAVEAFVQMLPQHPYVAPNMLATIGDQRAIKPLVEMGNRNVSHAVVRALAAIGGSEATELLLREVAKGDRAILGTHEAILNSDRNEVVPQLIELLNDPKCEFNVAMMLGEIGTPRADAALKQHLRKTKSKKTRDYIESIRW